MKNRLMNLMGFSDASEGKKSNYSTERSPRTALLFEATRTVPLPLVQFAGTIPSAEQLLQGRSDVGCSVQE